MNKSVEIRTWPQRTNVVVIDVERAVPIAVYPINPENANGNVFDPLCCYEERAEHAIKLLESDQEFLRQAFLADNDVEIRLEVAPGSRTFISQVLNKYDLNIDSLNIDKTSDLIDHFDLMPIERLFGLLVDWYDVIERHGHFGASQKTPAPWVERSAPDNCYLYHYLNDGRTSRPAQPDRAAFNLMMETLDVNGDDYTFGHLLRWVYYSRAEFAELPRVNLKAWTSLTE